MWAWAWFSVVFAAAPAPVVLTAEEAAAVQAGEVLVRAAPTSTGELVGVVDIPGATLESTWKAVLDWDMRVETVDAVKAISVYAPESDPGGLGVKFELSVLGSAIVYHLRYEIDRAAGWCVYSLDPAMPNDLVSSVGSYRIDAIPGGQRLTYRSQTDSGQVVPGFLRKWVATSSIRDQLAEMRKRATP